MQKCCCFNTFIIIHFSSDFTFLKFPFFILQFEENADDSVPVNRARSGGKSTRCSLSVPLPHSLSRSPYLSLHPLPTRSSSPSHPFSLFASWSLSLSHFSPEGSSHLQRRVRSDATSCRGKEPPCGLRSGARYLLSPESRLQGGEQ